MNITHLIVIAGPSGIGKSTVIGKLSQGTSPNLGTELGLSELQSYTLVDPSSKLPKLDTSTLSRVILHYDIIRRSSFDQDPVFQLIVQCHKITWITLWAKAKVLAERHKNRKAREITGTSVLGKLLNRTLKATGLIGMGRKSKIYRSSGQLESYYVEWFKSTEVNNDDQHWVVDVNDLDQLIVVSKERWMEQRSELIKKPGDFRI